MWLQTPEQSVAYPGLFSLAVAPPQRGSPATGLVGEDPNLEVYLKRWRADWMKHMSKVHLGERGQLLIGQEQRGGVLMVIFIWMSSAWR